MNYTANRADLDAYLTGAGPNTFVAKEWGGSVGGHVGYNWARCNALWGFEVDANWASATASASVFNVPGFTGDVKSELNGFATARARAGIVVDNLLLYVTGGLATTHTSTVWTSSFAGLGVMEAVSANKWGIGWVAGFGTEWAVNDRLSVRSEALYIDIMDQNYTLASPVFFILTDFNPSFKNSDSMWIARLGANYKFSN